MAVESKSGKQGDSTPELISTSAVQNNLDELHKVRVFTSIATGTAAGLLDLKGFCGFALFGIVLLFTLMFMLVKTKMTIGKYFRPSSKFLLTSLWDATASFVLFWTFFANVLYLYG